RHDFEIPLGRDDATQAFGDQRVVVGDEDLDRHFAGARTTTDVPPPRRGTTSKRAPIASERSLIVAMPKPFTARPFTCGATPTPSSEMERTQSSRPGDASSTST